jgi:hypothetical protein
MPDRRSGCMKKALTYISEEVPFFLRSVKEGMNSYGKYDIIYSVVGLK